MSFAPALFQKARSRKNCWRAKAKIKRLNAIPVTVDLVTQEFIKPKPGLGRKSTCDQKDGKDGGHDDATNIKNVFEEANVVAEEESVEEDDEDFVENDEDAKKDSFFVGVVVAGCLRFRLFISLTLAHL